MSELPDQQPLAVRLQFEWPEDLMSRYATNFVAQHTLYEFTLSFFEVLAPVLLGSPEENRKQLAGLENVPAKCVARIILSPNGMLELIGVLQRNYQMYLAATQQQAEE